MAVCLWVRCADMLCVSTFVASHIQWRVSHSVDSGAQVGVASFVVNFLVDQNIGISKSKASQLFSFCQITFTVGRSAIRKSSGIDRTHCISRFVGVAILNFVDPALLLTLYAVCCCVFCGSIVVYRDRQLLDACLRCFSSNPFVIQCAFLLYICTLLSNMFVSASSH